KEATEQGEEAKEVGTTEEVDRLSRRTVRVTKEHNAECQRLLKLMGIPCVVAPSEAEAQCAELARGGKVYAAGSEDMDTLTFGAPTLFRHLTFSEAKKAPIVEVNLQKALEGLEMNMSQFAELCLLLGCDYLEPIKGVGPKSALKLLREHGSLKEVIKQLRAKQSEREVKNAEIQEQEEEEEEDVAATSEIEPEEEDRLTANEEDDEEDAPKQKPAKKISRRIEDSDEEDGDLLMRGADEGSDAEEKEAPQSKTKSVKGKGKAKASPKKASAASKPKPKGKGGISVPEYWPWEEAKELFLKPDVTPADQLDLNWEAPDVDGLVEFLVREKGFNEDRVRKGAEKLQKMIAAKQQGRLDGFFTVKPKEKEPASSKGGKDAKGTKRKASVFSEIPPYV
ncbi:Elongation of fatty acids protein 2, partial [Tulasnella sp. 417]